MTADTPRALYGLLAEFDTPADILRAAERVRQAGFRRWDVFSPFPVRGLARAMGLGQSPVGWFAFWGGLAGAALGGWMVWYMNAQDYPLLVGGKPFFSPFPAVPLAYELAILLAAFGAVLGLLWRSRLPRLHHPLLKQPRFVRASHDKFLLVIEAADPKFSEAETRKLLEAAGSRHIEEVQA